MPPLVLTYMYILGYVLTRRIGIGRTREREKKAREISLDVTVWGAYILGT